MGKVLDLIFFLASFFKKIQQLISYWLKFQRKKQIDEAISDSQTHLNTEKLDHLVKKGSS